MIRGLIEGKRSAAWMADWGLTPLRSQRKDLKLALEGLTNEHHRWLMQERLQAVEEIAARVARVEAEIRRRVAPYQELIARLDEIPGVDEITCWTRIAELGVDMQVFQALERVCSWAALCAGNRESASKRHSGNTRKGNRYIRRALVQVAWAVLRTKDTYLRAKFWRMASKVWKKKAAVAVAHHVLRVVFLMIRHQARYQELGGRFYDQIDPIRTKNKLVSRLKALGYEVTITPVTAPAVDPFQTKDYLASY